MIVCPHCSHVNPDTRILCTNCYKPLRPDERRWMGFFYIGGGILAIAIESRFDYYLPGGLIVVGVLAIIWGLATLVVGDRVSTLAYKPLSAALRGNLIFALIVLLLIGGVALAFFFLLPPLLKSPP